MKRLSHQKVKNAVFKTRPEVNAAYEALQDEFALNRVLLKARKAAGLTQEQLAEKMHTNKSNISCLENVDATPSLTTLRKYAHVVGCKLKIAFVPQISHKKYPRKQSSDSRQTAA